MGGKGSGRKANGVLESQGRTRMANMLPQALDNISDELDGKPLHPQVHASSWKVANQNLGMPSQSHDIGFQAEQIESAAELLKRLNANRERREDAIQGSGEAEGSESEVTA